MRVVLLITDLEPGGSPLRIARLARGLTAAGVNVHVGCLAPLGPVGSALANEGIDVFACDARSNRDVFVLRRLTSLLRRIAPDLIHATLTHANVAARIVGRRLHVPVLTSTATIEVERRWHLKLERWTGGMDRGHIVNSRATADHVTAAFNIPTERVFVVPPSIDLPDSLPARDEARNLFDLPPEAFAILWAGRFDPVKRIDLAVRAFAALPDQTCRLLLAGDGPLRERMETLAAESPARDRIHFLGWQDNLTRALAAADLLLFPSLTEGMPNVVMQAMAAGVPVVGSDIPSLRELSGDVQRLTLIPGQDAQAYAAAVAQLMRDDDARRSQADRAAEWARVNLDSDLATRAVLTIYERTLNA